MWPNCSFEKYVGLTSPSPKDEIHGFKIVPAQETSGWRGELKDQLSALPSHISHVLLLLDDFLILKRVDEKSVEAVYTTALKENMRYVRVQAVERSFILSLFQKMRSVFTGQTFYRFNRSEPYYSSLQAAIWDRKHLIHCLGQPGSIWEFEHYVPKDSPHFAVASSVIIYRHLVERGQWRAYSHRLFRKVGRPFNPGERFMRPKIDYWNFLITKLKFGLIGYMGMKGKKFFKRLIKLKQSA